MNFVQRPRIRRILAGVGQRLLDLSSGFVGPFVTRFVNGEPDLTGLEENRRELQRQLPKAAGNVVILPAVDDHED